MALVRFKKGTGRSDFKYLQYKIHNKQIHVHTIYSQIVLIHEIHEKGRLLENQTRCVLMFLIH